MRAVRLYPVLILLLSTNYCLAQQVSDSTAKARQYKNIIRYNISGPLLFGADRYVIFGYERVLSPHQSFSINIGKVSLPKLTVINTDSFSLEKDLKSSGFNLSLDYRFYLAKENKFAAPRGVYIGPWYSYNSFKRDNQWKYNKNSAQSYVDTHSDFKINSFGFELGYQFILWKRLALDLVMVGPGFAFYRYKATFDGNLDAATKDQLLEGLKQLLTQKFPGMNYVFTDSDFNADGVMSTNSIGFRYMVHIGFNF